jgi:hypothetical protein
MLPAAVSVLAVPSMSVDVHLTVAAQLFFKRVCVCLHTEPGVSHGVHHVAQLLLHLECAAAHWCKASPVLAAAQRCKQRLT